MFKQHKIGLTPRTLYEVYDRYFRREIKNENTKFSMTWAYEINSVNPDGSIADTRKAIGTNTNQWGTFLAALLAGATTATISISIKDTGAVVDTVAVFSSAPTTSGAGAFNYAGVGLALSYIQLGTGTLAATRADYILQTPITGTSNISFSFTAGAGAVTGSASITYGTAQTPSELGLFITWGIATLVAKTFLMDHAVFTALASNTTFTITYTITLS